MIDEGSPTGGLVNEPYTLHSVYSPDMTLHDWFAGMALDGVIRLQATSFFGISPATIAERCYAIASAMLAEKEWREKEES